MISPTAMLLLTLGITMVLIGALVRAPEITEARGGKIMAFVALFLLPTLGTLWAFSVHIERSKETSFCLSCHVMQPYGRSLMVDDKSWIPASHYENHRVPREEACFTCHTTYTMYGDIRAKMTGLHHIWVEYVEGAKPPLRLYEPYNNRECLHCHAGARSFEEEATHSAMMDDLKNNSMSCLTSGCHDTIHNIEHLKDAKMWSPPKS